MESQAVVKEKPETQRLKNNVSLYISKSYESSRINKTGSWRFARPVYENKTAPCSAACPAGNYIPEVVMRLTNGDVRGAYRSFIKENPFPATCGRVCFHTCETACNRKGQDRAVGIRCMERYVGDRAMAADFPLDAPSVPATGKKVAILGAGPAGLSAAYFLTRLGIACDIFESTDRAGGVMQWGIPAHRLPKPVLNHEIDNILKLGIKIHYNHILDETFFSKAQDDFDGVFISPGLSIPLTMGIDGETHVKEGLQLLMDIQRGTVSPQKGRVAVIGGGNTAIDVARSLKRLGADPIIVYRRRKQEMPAFEEEILEAQKEGVEIRELKSPVAVKKTARGLELNVVTMTPVAEKGTDGRTRVIPVDDTMETMVFNDIYSGIGAALHGAWKPAGTDMNTTFANIKFDLKEIPFVYGGDCVNPVQSVTHAIASGKEAALALAVFFQDGINKVGETLDTCRVGKADALSMEIYLKGKRKDNAGHVVMEGEINRDYFISIPRIDPEHMMPETAVTTFDEVEKTYTEKQALAEANRCYQCGFCNECENCRIFCPEISITRQNGRKVIDLDYCKGCGVCSVECPRNAITMEEEK
ncbi:FAD-dependent oxidoreductase [Desulfocicer niacini]